MPECTLLFSWEGREANRETEEYLQSVASACAASEPLSLKCYAELLLTDDQTIHSVNRNQRGVDRATDVLSFPAAHFSPEKTAGMDEKKLRAQYDPDEGACYLGQAVLSLETAQRQAQEYGHSFRRELGYLTAHALFHLMGYDHEKEDDQRRMRLMEEKALSQLNVLRIPADELRQKALQAMENSYSPYSGYAVGAALLCEDGTVYTGCNVENSSYGLTNCAERTAVFKAVSEGKRRFCAIAIAAKGSAPWPCGACRQVLYEFSPDMTVYITWDGQTAQAPLKALLPSGFGPEGSATSFLGGAKS